MVEECEALAAAVLVTRQREQVRGVLTNLVTIHRGLPLPLQEQSGGVLVIERNQNSRGNIESLGGDFLQIFSPVNCESPFRLSGESGNYQELVIIRPDNPGAFLSYDLSSHNNRDRLLTGFEDPEHLELLNKSAHRNNLSFPSLQAVARNLPQSDQASE